MRSLSRHVLCIVLILAICWFVSENYFQLMLIQGDSMMPSYHNMQLVILDKRNLAYQPGDVIVFRCEGLSAILVKRIVSVAGETVVIEDGTLFVNGMESPFYEPGVFTSPGILSEKKTLSDDTYIVIGDNVEESIDSRDARVGIIHADDIIGKIVR